MSGVSLRVRARPPSLTAEEVLRAAETIERADDDVDEARLSEGDTAWWRRASANLAGALRGHCARAPSSPAGALLGVYRASAAPAAVPPLGLPHMMALMLILRDLERLTVEADSTMGEGARAARRRMLACVSAAALGLGVMRAVCDDDDERAVDADDAPVDDRA